jgi:putative intracellular protease/amidase
MKKILMTITSHKELLNTKSTSGVWLGEFTDPYYELLDAGYQVDLASPLGGEPPVDPVSKLTEHITSTNRRFLSDEKAQNAFKNTKPLSQVKAEDYVAVFYPGGHGPVFDLATNAISGQMILDFYKAGKPLAFVCHGPAALIKAAELRPDFLRGKRVTSFSNEEEILNMRSGNVPYKLETRLKELGADFHQSPIPFASHVEVDGLLVTGQNPLSAGPTAKALLKVLEGSLKANTVH